MSMLTEAVPWPILVIGGYIFAISVVTFLAFVSDKNYAVVGATRTREKTLLFLVVIGGTLGAALAMHRFRHKTKKVSFLSKFIVVVIIQAAIIGGIIYLYAPRFFKHAETNLTN